MKLTKITNNCHDLTLDTGVRLLFSYADVVAAYVPNRGWFKTEEPLTKSSQWCVAEWFDKQGAENVVRVPQGTFETLIASCETSQPETGSGESVV